MCSAHTLHTLEEEMYPRLLSHERLNRKEYLLVEGQKTKPKRFKSYEPGFFHVDIKYLPKIDKIRHYLFVAIDRNTRLVTIGNIPQIRHQGGRDVPAAIAPRLFRIYA